MKKFKFELTLCEEDLEGDEFWQEAVSKDGTGIQDLTEFLCTIFDESNLLVNHSGLSAKNIIKLVEYTDK